MAAELRLHGSAAEGSAAEVVPPPPGYVEYTKSKGCDCCEPVKIKTKNKKGLLRFIGMMNAHGGEINEGNGAGKAPSLPQSPTLVAEHLRGEADGDPKGDGGDGGDGAPVTERVKRWEGGRGKPRPKHIAAFWSDLVRSQFMDFFARKNCEYKVADPYLLDLPSQYYNKI